MTNPITEEIRAIRHELAARFDNDLDRIFADLRRQQQESGRDYIKLPRRTPRVHRATNNPMPPLGEVGRFEVENLSSPPGDPGR